MIRVPIYTENRQQAAPPAYNGERREEMTLEQNNDLGYYEPPAPNIIPIILGMLIFFILGLFMYLFFLYGQSSMKCPMAEDCISGPANRKNTFPQFKSSTQLIWPATISHPITSPFAAPPPQQAHTKFVRQKVSLKESPGSGLIDNAFTTSDAIKKRPLQKFVPKEAEKNWGVFDMADLDYEDVELEGSGEIENI